MTIFRGAENGGLSPIWNRWKWPVALAACLFAAGLLSVRQGLDVNWDLKNYHFYNAYAFLNDRLGFDVAPAQLQTYFNPLLDLPFYYLVQAIPSPRIIAFAMGLTAGVGAFCLLWIVSVLFAKGATADRVLWIALAWMIGVTGSMAQSTLGSTMNEWPPAMLLLLSLAIVLTSAARNGVTAAAIVSAGLITGLAVGLKLTYGIFGFALAIALASWGPLAARVKRVALVGAALFAGFLVSYGAWGWSLYREFGNPLFPFFNGIFQSAWWEPASLFDRTFGPRTLLQWVFFPLYFARESHFVSEIGFKDYRLAVLLVLGIACAARFGFRRQAIALPWRIALVFTLAAYLLWLKVFSIYRYLVPLELLSGPLIVGALLYLVPGLTARRVAIVVLAALVIGTTRKGSWGRLEFRGAYFDLFAPTLPRDSLVIMGVTEPMAYIIPFFRPDARFVNPVSNFLRLEQKNLLARRIGEIVAGHKGPIYSLDFRTYDGVETTLAHYGLARDLPSCQPIRSRLDSDAMRICRAVRVAR